MEFDIPGAPDSRMDKRSKENDPSVQKEVNMRKALVCGAGGFIRGHLVKKLKREGYWVRGVDIKDGIGPTYPWVKAQVRSKSLGPAGSES